MIKKNIRENVMLRADGFNGAIMGLMERAGQDPVLLYDTDKVLKLLVEDSDMSYEEAEEFFRFNILAAWVGEDTPAFFRKASLEELDEMEVSK
jgi:hypothetical protein